MSITPFPPLPSRSRPASFSDEADTFFSALPQFVDEVNGLTTQYEADAATLSENTPLVLAVANFKGPWSILTGPLSIPASVYHLGNYWHLLTNIADVTTEVPGTSTAWASASLSNHIFNLANGVV